MNEMALTPQQLAETLRAGVRDKVALQRSNLLLKQIDAHLVGQISPARKDVGVSRPGENVQFINRAYYYHVSKHASAQPTVSVYLVPGSIWWGISAWGSREETERLAEDLRRYAIVQNGDDLSIRAGSFTDAWTGGSLLLLGKTLTADLLEGEADLEPIIKRIGSDLAEYHGRLAPYIDEFFVQQDDVGHKRAWLFQANPQFFDLANATDVREIEVGTKDFWSVMRYGSEMQPGDPVVLWQSGDKAGIYALGRITSEPYEREVPVSDEEIKERPYLESKNWVDLEYTDILERPILRSEVKEHPVLANMLVMRAPQGTNFRLTDEEWKAVKALVAMPPLDESKIDELVISLLPDNESRQVCLHYFADCIEQAHALAPYNWGITVLTDRIRLNVGSVVVFTLHLGRLWLAVDGLGEAQRNELGSRVNFTPEYDYKILKPATTLYVPPENIAHVRGILQEPQLAFLERAARSTLRPPSKNIHSREFIRYLRRTLNREVLQPTYAMTGRVFKIAPGPNAQFWNDCLENGYICVGWDEIGDLKTFESRGDYETSFTATYSDLYNGNSSIIKRKAEEVWTLRELRPGDIVVANQGKTRVLAIGKVQAPGYVWRPERDEMRHTVSVNWDTSYEQDIPTQSRWGFHTVLPLSQDTYHKLLKRDWSANRIDVVPTLGEWLSSNGFYFTPWQIATYFTALQTKGFVILSGISGTGKSKLAQFFAEALYQSSGSPSSPTGEAAQNWHFTSVRPDWRDSKSLLGYYNPLTANYEWTPFLHFLLDAGRSYEQNEQIPWFVILDEMNLAHVEYYFADLLSVLESGRDEEGWTREPVQLVYPDGGAEGMPPREIHLPPNLYVVGTVNVDETTHAFSPKVQDRAFTLELTEADFSHYPPDGLADDASFSLSDGTQQALLDIFSDAGQFVRIDKGRIAGYVAQYPHVRHWLQSLNNRLRPYGFHFGYRVFDEIVTFLAHAEDNQVYQQVLAQMDSTVYADLDAFDLAFDAAVLMKVLPKFHGTRGQLEGPLLRMLAWCVDPAAPDNSIATSGDLAALERPFRLPHTSDRLRCMWQMLQTTGFAT